MKKIFLLSFFFFFIFSLSYGVHAASWCYQETANASSAADTANCGLNYTGNYSYSTSSGYSYINYTKPQNATVNSLWQVKQGSNTTILNLSLRQCWFADPNKLILRQYSTSSGTGYSDSQCYDGVNWISLNYVYNPTTLAGTNSVDSYNATNDGNYSTGALWSSIFPGWRSPSSQANEILAQKSMLYEESMQWRIDSCSYNGIGNWTIYANDSCYINYPVNLLNNSIKFVGDGTYSVTSRTIIDTQFTNISRQSFTNLTWNKPSIYLLWNAVLRFN